MIRNNERFLDLEVTIMKESKRNDYTPRNDTMPLTRDDYQILEGLATSPIELHPMCPIFGSRTQRLIDNSYAKIDNSLWSGSSLVGSLFRMRIVITPLGVKQLRRQKEAVA